MIKRTMVDPTPPKGNGWVNLEAPASEGWSPKLLDDSPLVLDGIRRTRDERGNTRTFYRQIVSKRELNRLRRRVARIIEKDKKEERDRRMLRFVLRVR